jgi:hypothetical protein
MTLTGMRQHIPKPFPLEFRRDVAGRGLVEGKLR